MPICLLRPKPYLKTPNAHNFFSSQKVAFTKDIKFLNVVRVFEIWIFLAILKYVKTPKTVSNVPKNLSTIKKTLEILKLRVSETYIEFCQVPQ